MQKKKKSLAVWYHSLVSGPAQEAARSDVNTGL